MTTFFYCSNCGKKVRLKYTSREEVPYLLVVRCPYCSEINILTSKEVEEEGVCRFRCTLCGTTLYFEYVEPEETVKCPVCGTVFSTNTKECKPKVLKYGTLSIKYRLYWYTVFMGYLRSKNSRELLKYMVQAEVLNPKSARAEKVSA